MQERQNSSALALELHLSCANPSIYCWESLLQHSTGFNKLPLHLNVKCLSLYLIHESEILILTLSNSKFLFCIWYMFDNFYIQYGTYISLYVGVLNVMIIHNSGIRFKDFNAGSSVTSGPHHTASWAHVSSCSQHIIQLTLRWRVSVTALTNGQFTHTLSFNQ